MTTESDLRARIAELETALKQRDRRIAELKQENDEQRDFIERCIEAEEDTTSVLEAWRDTFGMQMTDDGRWTWKPFWEKQAERAAAYDNLVWRWNAVVPEINAARFGKQPVGRPLDASKEQVATVRRLHEQGRSLRDIADETNVGFATVRTIVGQIDGTDRTTQNRRERLGLERIKIDKAERARWQRQKRTGDALPKRAQAQYEKTRALIAEAKGLGKAR